ncbi:ribosomal protein S19, mitochondrial-like [Prosopis cineraria]|uniref:ribosomal protein S19, mitochondrial-like n=1 Tax=Prosopis cineraria TaxID=364024 RepID=UPI00240FAF24|nr:ribosomal protein S19, mitochondrial-like [Prosopis cineraria]
MPLREKGKERNERTKSGNVRICTYLYLFSDQSASFFDPIRSSIFLPEFVNCSVRIYNGKSPVRSKITEGKVGHKFGEFASTRKRRLSRTNIKAGRKKEKKSK